jgi:CBS domain-containing protein
LGWLFIAAGIAQTFGIYVPYFGTGFASGLWLAFIGWFIYTAASHAHTRIALDDALAGVTVAQLMRTDVPGVPSSLTLGALVQDYLVRAGDRAVPVVEDGRFVGIVGYSDIRKVPPERWATTSLAAVMRGADELAVTAPDRPLSEALQELIRRDIEQMPVVADGRLVGMLRRRDVARWVELAWRPEWVAGSARNPSPWSLPPRVSPYRSTRRREDEGKPNGGAADRIGGPAH